MITSRKLRCVGHTGRIREMKNTYKIVVGKSEGRDHLGENNIKIDLKHKVTMESIHMVRWVLLSI